MKKLTFSQKMGKTPIKTEIQKDDIDLDLKRRLWNVIYIEILDREPTEMSNYPFYRELWIDFYGEEIDKKPRYNSDFLEYVKQRFFSDNAFKQVYDFIDFFFERYPMNFKPTFFKKNIKLKINCILEEENSAYRIVDWDLAPITNETEIQEIEQAVITESEAVNSHMATALKLFSEKGTKDYKNIIKESILAVEAAAKIVSEKPNAVLDDALAIIKKKHKLHTTFEKAFSNLYYYTSDKKTGIRHGLIDDSDIEITFDDAKFMIVACSAFVNYLMVLKDK